VPIQSDLTERALGKLQLLTEKCPDVRRTIDRGYFHSYDDHGAARAVLYDEIHREPLTAHFVDMKWHHRASDADGGSEARALGGLHPLVALLGALSF
jgi:hypothetical protein